MCSLFLWCKASFSASSVIHDPPEIIAAQETFLIIITIEKPVLLHMFIETVMHYQKFNVRFSKKEGKIIIIFF